MRQAVGAEPALRFLIRVRQPESREQGAAERTDVDGAHSLRWSPYILRRRIALERRYQWGGEVLFYVCAGCQRPRRHLYPWPVIDGRLVQDLNPRCRQCAGLRYLTQGIPGGGPHTEPWQHRSGTTAAPTACFSYPQ